MTLVAALLFSGGAPAAAEEIEGYPVRGKSAPGMEALDKAVVAMLSRHGIPGASLAVAEDGKLLFARGYGWACIDTREAVRPDTVFGVASLSKTFTAAAALRLVEEGKLSLDDKPFKMLSHIRPRPGAKPDPRLAEITVRQLLNHSGGWDTHKSGDPVNWTTEMQYKRGDRKPISAEALISMTMGTPLDFEPGAESKYSNFGYIVLGEVIEKASGVAYGKYVAEHVLKPAGVKSARLQPLDAGYAKNEARRYLAGTDTELPPWRQKYSDAAGGWAVSSVDMVRFMTALDGTRGKPLLSEKSFQSMIALPPKPLGKQKDGTHVGLGWDSVALSEKEFAYFKDGGWFGMRAFMKRVPGGVNWVLVFNASMQPNPQDTQGLADAVKHVREHLDQIEKFEAGHDLFKEYP